MSKFSNAFKGISGGSSDSTSTVDWAEYNKALVAAAGTQDRARNMVGVISGITDLGIQPIEDGKIEFKGSDEEEEKILAEKPDNYFEDLFDYQSKTTKRYQRWPSKPQRAVALTIDFPKLQFNYGQYFGEEDSKPKAIRTLLNGEFTPKGKKPHEAIVGRIYDLKETTKDFAPKWSLAPNSVLYKLAVATDVIKQGEPFSKDDIGELIGKYAQFEIRIWEEGGYLQEKVAFKGRVSEEALEIGLPAYDEDILYFIRLDSENEAAHVKQLRRTVKNTIKRSESYEGSQLQKQFDSVLFPAYAKKDSDSESENDSEPSSEAPAPSKPKTEKKKKDVAPPPEYDDDIPF